ARGHGATSLPVRRAERLGNDLQGAERAGTRPDLLRARAGREPQSRVGGGGGPDAAPIAHPAAAGRRLRWAGRRASPVRICPDVRTRRASLDATTRRSL